LHESAVSGPHGFPITDWVGKCNGKGVQINITAQMMAVRAAQYWMEKECDEFLTLYFFGTLLQKIFLDRGLVSKAASPTMREMLPAALGTQVLIRVIIGSLGKGAIILLPLMFVGKLRG
jgi:hypothetical protein